MKKILTAIAVCIFATPAFAHPGMEQSASAVHEALHLSGSFEPLILIVAIAVGIVAYKKRF